MKHLANALVFASVLAAALPSLVPLLRRAVVLAPMSVEERRAHVMPDFYPSLRTIPRGRPAAILLLGDNAIDRGVFVNYYLYAAIVLAAQKRWRPLALAGAMIVPMLLLYAAVYAVSPWELRGLTEHLAPRVLTHLLGPAFFLWSAMLDRSPMLGRNR
ncbi:MAG TPA: hypothetical protein VF432_21940 [Thermoanaerobaculia bacterium]